MFIDLANALTLGPGDAIRARNSVLTQYNAEQLSYYIDRVWEQPRAIGRAVVPYATLVDNITHESWSLQVDNDIQVNGFIPALPQTSYWRHIVYGYLLECTNIEEVFRRVIHEWVNGERLPFPTLATHVWIRTTEQLFFSSPLPPSIRSLTSDIRPSRNAIRQNAYFRLLGFELPQPGSNSFIKPDAANREFLRAWEQLLRETWSAYMNITTTVAANPTDPTALGELVREIGDMLRARRLYGNLSREEFDAVTRFSWFHLALFGNTAIVNNLNAQSSSSALRLQKIGNLVGVPVHSKSDSFFQMSFRMAYALEVIEAGLIGPVNVLYAGGGPLAQAFRFLWSHWQLATGRAIKGMEGVIPSVRPLAIPAAAAVLPATPRFQPAMR